MSAQRPDQCNTLTVRQARALDVHPLAALFPPLEGSERELLRSSLEAGYDAGQPLALDRYGKLLDGRNRRDLALELGLTEIPAEVFNEIETDAQAADFVMRRNLARRNLGPEQRDDLIRKLAAKGVQAKLIAERLGISKRTVERKTKTEREEAKAARDEKIEQALAEGASQREAAKAAGVDEKTVRRKRHGVANAAPSITELLALGESKGAPAAAVAFLGKVKERLPGYPAEISFPTDGANALCTVYIGSISDGTQRGVASWKARVTRKGDGYVVGRWVLDRKPDLDAPAIQEAAAKLAEAGTDPPKRKRQGAIVTLDGSQEFASGIGQALKRLDQMMTGWIAHGPDGPFRIEGVSTDSNKGEHWVEVYGEWPQRMRVSEITALFAPQPRDDDGKDEA